MSMLTDRYLQPMPNFESGLRSNTSMCPLHTISIHPILKLSLPAICISISIPNISCYQCCLINIFTFFSVKPTKQPITTANPNKINMESSLANVTSVPRMRVEKATIGGTAILHCYFDHQAQIGDFRHAEVRPQ